MMDEILEKVHKGAKHFLCHPERANRGEPKDLAEGKKP